MSDEVLRTTNARVLRVFKNLCALVLWTKIALELEGFVEAIMTLKTREDLSCT